MTNRKPRYYDVIAILLLFIIGSFFVFVEINIFLTNVLNYANKFNFPIIIATIPHLLLAMELVTFLFFFTRYLNLANKFRYHHIKEYAIIFLVYAIGGLITTILAGTYVYHNFLIDNPYPGVLIVLTIINLLLAAFSIVILVLNKKNKPIDATKYHVATKLRVLRIIIMRLFIVFALYRFGAFIWSFIYMDYAHFWLTFPFYLSLILPLVIEFSIFNPLVNERIAANKKIEYLIWSIYLAFGLSTGIYTIVTGINNPLFVALISPAMPIERLASIPVDAAILIGINVLIPIGRIIYISVKRK